MSVDSTPSGQQLMEAAVAAKGLANMVDSAWKRSAAAALEAPDTCCESLQMVIGDIQQASTCEVAAAELLALAYHARTSSVP
jgi:hypothetical protein